MLLASFFYLVYYLFFFFCFSSDREPAYPFHSSPTSSSRLPFTHQRRDVKENKAKEEENLLESQGKISSLRYLNGSLAVFHN